MPRSYRHISNYEYEILEMRRQGKTRKVICEEFGFSLKQVKTLSQDTIENRKNQQKGYPSNLNADPEKMKQNCHYQYSN